MAPPPLTLHTVPMQHILNRPPNDTTPTTGQHSLDAHRALIAGLREHGLVALHFPPTDLPDFAAALTPALHLSRRFFAAPLSQKATATPPPLPPGVTRGYSPLAAESGGDTLEAKEFFSWSADDPDLHPDPHPRRPFEHPNVWPCPRALPLAPDLRRAYTALYDYLHSVMAAIAAALDPHVPSHALHRAVHAGRSVSLARAVHYHPAPQAAPTATTGSVAHTDWGLATLIAHPPGSTALEVLHAGAWHPVRGRPDTLLLLAGDFLALASRGRFRSPPHRVVLAPAPRLSLLFFSYPPYRTPLPDVAGLDEVATALSLFADQRRGAGAARGVLAGGDDAPACFGDLLARKWEQVSRA